MSRDPEKAVLDADVWVFDLDNTLYPPSCDLFAQVARRMGEFISRALGMAPEEASALRRRYFHVYGTTLRGLMLERGMEPGPFLDYVHDIDVSPVPPSPTLDAALARLPGRKIIFTNGTTRHALNVTERLGVADRFDAIFDIVAADHVPKPDPRPYRAMIEKLGVDPRRAVMVEDIAINLMPARDLGMTTVWVRNDDEWSRPMGADDEARTLVDLTVDDLTAWLASLTGVPTEREASRNECSRTEKNGVVIMREHVHLPPVELRREDFQTVIDGRQVDLFTLRNDAGTIVRVTNQGSRIVQFIAPDREGRPGDVVQGYPTIERVIGGQKSMGAFIGRFANRVANARFTLDGVEWKLSVNGAPHHLHGGVKGSRFRVFDARRIDERTLETVHVFEDGEEGYPGELTLTVRYSLDDKAALTLNYEAVAAKRATIANFTDHSFFNLSGDGATSILDHELTIRASRALEVDGAGVPTGRINDLTGSPLDFRTVRVVGDRVEADDQQLKNGKGYDHFYILDAGDGPDARVRHPGSGRALEVRTSEPGIQFYSGNGLSGEVPRDVGKGERLYGFRSGFCLEPSHYPDAPNHPDFKGIVLRPGESYKGRVEYRLTVD